MHYKIQNCYSTAISSVYDDFQTRHPQISGPINKKQLQRLKRGFWKRRDLTKETYLQQKLDFPSKRKHLDAHATWAERVASAETCAIDALAVLQYCISKTRGQPTHDRDYLLVEPQSFRVMKNRYITPQRAEALEALLSYLIEKGDSWVRLAITNPQRFDNDSTRIVHMFIASELKHVLSLTG